NLALSGPDGSSVRRSWPIEVRSAQPVIHDREIAQVKPGESWTPPANLLARFEPGTARATLEVAPWRGFDLVGLLRRLDQYPLGCVEQTTSRALPLLTVAELAPLAGLPVGPELRDRLQRAVWRVADMQTAEGDFGMWGPNDYSDNWLSVYAFDFLTRAEAAGLHVPPETIKQGRDFLRKLTANHNTLRQRAYAYWVLARLNEASPGDLRYFHDVDAAKLDDPLALAQLGAALDRIGDRARAQSAFHLSLATMGTKHHRIGPYGSTLRDAAGALTMVAEARRDEMLPAFAEKAVALDTKTPSTQEMAWMVLAAQAMTHGKPMTVELGGKPLGPRAPAAASIDPAAGLALVNKGAEAVWRTVAVEGIPKTPLAAAQNGLNVTREVFTLDGEPADLAALRQNDRVVVILSGGGDGKREREISVLALLPAGLEIEGALVPEGNGVRDWMPEFSQPRATVKRDDRFAAAVTLSRRPEQAKTAPPIEESDPPAGQFRVGFVARAVNVGSFTLPPVLVEDMYYPAVRGNTDTGTVAIAP
ncbi:MAG: hypothetical protein HQL39_19685, partial [Alphaproteobacteria bacterium]|nr:hypothetical protein [Alphaproteobacteria bacterium]